MDEWEKICPELNRGVFVTGASMTKFRLSKQPTHTLRDLAAKAALEAMEQASLKRDEIDMVIVSNAIAMVSGQGHTNALIVSFLGMNPTPSIRVECACASGSNAIRMGVMAIEAGFADNVLVVGAEIMSGMNRNMIQQVLGAGSDAILETPTGCTFPGLYATAGMKIIDEQVKSKGVQYGMDSLSYFAIQNHQYASYNPKAQFDVRIQDLAKKRDMELWDFLHHPKFNPVISYPLRLFDCSPISDGGAAVVLTGKDVAESYNSFEHSIEILATAQATGYLPMGLSPSISSLYAAEKAALAAYKRIELSPDNPLERVHVAEVHDCFTSAEVMALGDLHFFKRSQTLDAARRGDLALDGKIPTNTSGGLKAKGHPIGVTGISQVVTLMDQLNGKMPHDIQVESPDIALHHNIGGTGGTAVVTLYAKPEGGS